jgi:transposase
MSRPKTSINQQLIEQAENDLQKAKGKQRIRLLSIIAYKDKKIKEITEIFHISARMFFIFLNRYKQIGIDGLSDRAKGHRKQRLNKEETEKIYKWIKESKDSKGKHIHWTLERFVNEIEIVFNKKIGQSTMWYQLKRLNIALKVPRPVHYQADKEQQEKFKKKHET